MPLRNEIVLMKKRFNRRDFLRAVGAGTASLVAGCTDTFSRQLEIKAAIRKLNIVLILVDDLGWKDVGFMGSEYYETPNIDRVAREGMVFTNAYSNGPNCAPSRACLLSGQYAPRHGVYTVGSSARQPVGKQRLVPVHNKRILDSEIVTIAEALKQAGYVSASIGKWHLGSDPELGPVSQGFDVNVGGNESGQPKSYFSPYQNKDISDGLEGEYLTNRLTNEALKFIEQNRDKPFFLYLPHYAVHTPLQAKKSMIEKYKRKRPSNGQKNPTYAAMIESTDQGIGKIMDKLDEFGLTDNTIVFFFSDNGGVGGVTSMAPLRGAKGMLYEGGIRVPMIVRWPGRIKSGCINHTPVIGTDFYPTILEIASLAKPSGHLLDGESLVPLLTKAANLKRDAIFWHFPAYLQGKCKSLNDPYFRTRPVSAVRKDNWKLLEFFEDSRLELYNLKDDIGERNNLAQEMPEKVKELHQTLMAWRKSVGAKMPTRKN